MVMYLEVEMWYIDGDAKVMDEWTKLCNGYLCTWCIYIPHTVPVQRIDIILYIAYHYVVASYAHAYSNVHVVHNPRTVRYEYTRMSIPVLSVLYTIIHVTMYTCT